MDESAAAIDGTSATTGAGLRFAYDAQVKSSEDNTDTANDNSAVDLADLMAQMKKL